MKKCFSRETLVEIYHFFLPKNEGNGIPFHPSIESLVPQRGGKWGGGKHCCFTSVFFYFRHVSIYQCKTTSEERWNLLRSMEVAKPTLIILKPSFQGSGSAKCLDVIV